MTGRASADRRLARFIVGTVHHLDDGKRPDQQVQVVGTEVRAGGTRTSRGADGARAAHCGPPEPLSDEIALQRSWRIIPAATGLSGGAAGERTTR